MVKLLNYRRFLILIGLTAAASLSYAYISQYYFAVVPCQLCYYERLFYFSCVGLSFLALLKPSWSAPLFKGCLAVLVGGLALGVYHLGVEWHWWQAPMGCAGVDAKSLSLEEFKRQLMEKPVARCDQVNWVIFGISATIWNLLWFIGFLFLWLLTAFSQYRCQGPRRS